MLRGASVESADPLNDWSLQTRAAAVRPSTATAAISAAGSDTVSADVHRDVPVGGIVAGSKRSRAATEADEEVQEVEGEEEVQAIEAVPEAGASTNKRRRVRLSQLSDGNTWLIRASKLSRLTET